MTGNQIAMVICFCICLFWVILAVIFALLKEKALGLLWWLGRTEKALHYNKIKFSQDLKDNFLLWASIWFIGGVFTNFISLLFAAGALVLWVILIAFEIKGFKEKYIFKTSFKH